MKRDTKLWICIVGMIITGTWVLYWLIEWNIRVFKDIYGRIFN